MRWVGVLRFHRTIILHLSFSTYSGMLIGWDLIAALAVTPVRI
jgi:hypothetical protein